MDVGSGGPIAAATLMLGARPHCVRTAVVPMPLPSHARSLYMTASTLLGGPAHVLLDRTSMSCCCLDTAAF